MYRLYKHIGKPQLLKCSDDYEDCYLHMKAIYGVGFKENDYVLYDVFGTKFTIEKGE